MAQTGSLKAELDRIEKMQELLYDRGYLITTKEPENLCEYPFYGNWNAERVGNYFLCHHKKLSLTIYEKDDRTYFLFGHAYNAFTMEIDEGEILKSLSGFETDSLDFWRYESCLTGIYVMGMIAGDTVIYWTDCTGMLACYYGIVDGEFYCTSHSMLVAEECGLTEDPYVTELKNYRFYTYFGYNLPADLSPFTEVKRGVPNFRYAYDHDRHEIQFKRFYPYKRVRECRNREEYKKLVSRTAYIMRKSMKAIALKWPDREAAISVTGGVDSGMTLASAAGEYDSFKYFSYISNSAEAVDAYAARDICGALDLPHEIYEIPSSDEEIENIEVYRAILAQNGGNIGGNRSNDVRKRAFFHQHPQFTVEVKSWVDEIGRARYYKRYYAKRHFPKKPDSRLCTSLYKVFVHNRGLVKKTDALFGEYIQKYLGKDTTDVINWLDAFYWEFSWSAGEGVSMTSEHLFAYDITIPYNSRRIVELLLRAPQKSRIEDRLQLDVTRRNNKTLSQLDIHIVDVNHTAMRAVLERLYLEFNSHLPF